MDLYCSQHLQKHLRKLSAWLLSTSQKLVSTSVYIYADIIFPCIIDKVYQRPCTGVFSYTELLKIQSG